MFMLLYLQREAQAPYYATVALLLINQFNRAHRWGIASIGDFVVAVGRLFAELAAILAGVGLIIGALSLSGKVGSLTYALVQIAGDNVLLLLVMGAITSFILGIGMTVTAAYLFLAVTLAPALTQQGLDKLAVHLFLLYWGMISFITPPVALGAYAAASIAKSNPMKTGLEAMRLGSIIYFVPFFFVLNPALIGRGSLLEIAIVLTTAVAGIVLICAALQGYLYGVGPLDGNGFLAWPARALLLVSGLALALPGSDVDRPHPLAAPADLPGLRRRRRSPRPGSGAGRRRRSSREDHPAERLVIYWRPAEPRSDQLAAPRALRSADRASPMPTKNTLAQPPAERREQGDAPQVPGQDHDAGIAAVEELHAEVADGRHGERTHRQGQAGIEGRALAQHGDHGGRRDDGDDGRGRQAFPVRPYHQSIGPEPQPVLHATVTDAGKP